MQVHDRRAVGDFPADDLPGRHRRATPGCFPQQAMEPQGNPPPSRPHPGTPRPPSLRDTARLLVSRDLSWWTAAATGTVGAITFRTQAMHDAGESRNLHVRVLAGPTSRDTTQTGHASQPSAIIVADTDSLPGTMFPDNGTYVAIYAMRVAAAALTLRVASDIHALSGVYPLTAPEAQKGMADLACGLGGFSFGGEAAGWEVLIALDQHPQAVTAYQSIQHHPGRCVQADLSAPRTLRQVIDAGPAILAMRFPCQP